MSKLQNANPKQRRPTMLVCGIDPSRGKLAVSFIEDLKEFKYIEYENSFRDFKEFKTVLSKLKEKPPICIEGYGDLAKTLALYLKEHQYKVYEINPQMSSRLKESMTIHKTDHIDAFTCGLFPFLRNDLEELYLDKKIEGLKNLSRQYQKISKTTTGLKNQMHAALNQAFGPIYKEFFPELNNTSLTFFSNFASFKEIENVTAKKLHKGMITPKCFKYMGKYGYEKAKKIKKIVKNLNYCELEDFFLIQADVVKGYANILIQTLKQKENFQKKIKTLVIELFPEYQKFFSEFKGLTELQFGSLMAEIRDIDRFSTDAKLASYSGQGVAMFQSGTINRHRKNRHYNRKLAKIIHFLALNNVKQNGKYFQLYEARKKIYSKKLRALKSIKRKIVRLIFHRLKAYKKYLSIPDYKSSEKPIPIPA